MKKYFAFADSVEKIWPIHYIRFDLIPYGVLAKFNQHPNIDIFGLSPDIPTRLIELKLKASKYKMFHGLGGHSINEGRWYILYIGSTGVNAKQYDRLDNVTPADVFIQDVVYLDRRQKDTRKIEDIISLDKIPDASPAKLADALSFDHHKPKLVTCYNVGQGNCNAVCDDKGIPLVYYDFGGGVLGNAHTYPIGLKSCLCKCPSILLSHWDLDHWASGLIQKLSQDMCWIVPRQKPLGVTHIKFAITLYKRKKLLIWPNNLKFLPTSFGRIIKLPTHSNRNYSGLILLILFNKDGKNKLKYENVLLPGDAPYRIISKSVSLKSLNLKGLVAKHHGGSYAKDIAPLASGKSKIAYSYGQNNTYNHPRSISVTKHLMAGWSYRLDTPKGNILLYGRMKHSLRLKRCFVLCDNELNQS